MKRIGIFGESECGKTTLAQAISRETWRKQSRPSLVLVKFPQSWGRHAWVTTDKERFNETVWKREGCLVIVEDASSTINRDKTFKEFFTCIRHQKHELIVIGHDATNLTPEMRENLNEFFLFVQTERSVALWQESVPSAKGFDQATQLNQYEFLHVKKFQTARRCKLKL